MPSYTTNVPQGYTSPSWPSLYWPFNAGPKDPNYLYSTTDIWRFTLYWTLLFFGGVHVFASLWAVLMQLHAAFARRAHHTRMARNAGKTTTRGGMVVGGGGSVRQTLGWVWVVPLVYCVVGGIEALLAGSVVGLVLGAVYSAGYYKMSTWTPFLWGVINVLVIILGSFSIQGGL